MPSESANFNSYIDREVKRRNFVLTRWNIREQEKIEQEAENKRKAGIAPAATLTEEELLQKERVSKPSHRWVAKAQPSTHSNNSLT